MEGAAWSQIFGDAFESPNNRRRNKRITNLTPEGTHLAVDSAAWLARHQTKAQSRLERKCAARLVKLRHAPKAGGSGASTARPERIDSGIGIPVAAPRMPPLAERGTEPQVLAFELDVLAERFRESLFDKTLHTSARPGLIEAGKRLRERFLLCALSRAPAAEATELLTALHERGLPFDYAFALPPPPGGGRAYAHASPVLDAEAMRMLRAEMGMTTASMERRLLVVLSVCDPPTPLPTSRGDAWRALLTNIPLVTRGRSSWTRPSSMRGCRPRPRRTLRMAHAPMARD